MVDLAPEGCLSLRDFFDAFTSWKWNTDDLIGELALEDRIASLPDERKGQHRAGLAKVKLSALIHEPSFKAAAGTAVLYKARYIVTVGNRAVHEAKATPQRDAIQAVAELFHVGFWLARTYARRSRPPDGLAFDVQKLNRRDDALRLAHGNPTRRRGARRGCRNRNLFKDQCLFAAVLSLDEPAARKL